MSPELHPVCVFVLCVVTFFTSGSVCALSRPLFMPPLTLLPAPPTGLQTPTQRQAKDVPKSLSIPRRLSLARAPSHPLTPSLAHSRTDKDPNSGSPAAVDGEEDADERHNGERQRDPNHICCQRKVEAGCDQLQCRHNRQ